MAVRPEASIPSVTSSAVEYHEKPDPPFLKKGHMELSSLSLSRFESSLGCDLRVTRFFRFFFFLARKAVEGVKERLKKVKLTRKHSTHEKRTCSATVRE
jgi:hypothetical protein